MPLGFIPTVVSHGNANSTKPFYPTLPSTADHIRSKCDVSGPKEVLASVSAGVGGILHASYPGELPRDEQQISQYKKRCVASSSGISQLSTKGDELYTVMLQAQLEDSEKFARDVKMFPEPAC